MKVALDGVPEETRQQPSDVVTLKIDPRTGEPASPDQQNALFEYFLADHAPTDARFEPDRHRHRFEAAGAADRPFLNAGSRAAY